VIDFVDLDALKRAPLRPTVLSAFEPLKMRESRPGVTLDGFFVRLPAPAPVPSQLPASLI